MISLINPPTERPIMTTTRIVSLLLGIFVAGWLAIAPFLALIGGMILFQYVPTSFAIITLAPRPGILPEPVIGLIISFASFLLQAIVFFPLWLITRKRANWEPLHAIAGGLLAASAYLLAWSCPGCRFPDNRHGRRLFGSSLPRRCSWRGCSLSAGSLPPSSAVRPRPRCSWRWAPQPSCFCRGWSWARWEPFRRLSPPWCSRFPTVRARNCSCAR